MEPFLRSALRPKGMEWAEIPPSPWQGVRFVDSHLHMEGDGAREALALAQASGILLLSCGVDRKSSSACLRLASANQSVMAFVGVHPSEVSKERSTAWVRRALETATGVGEVGLDPKYSPVGQKSAQLKAFTSQLAEAARAGKPVQVHSRGAEEECLDALASAGLKRVLMHWFQAEESLPRVLDSGYFVSFGPSFIYSKRLQRMAARCDPSQVLPETDFPVGFGPLGGARGPLLVPSVVFRLSEVWGMPFEEARMTTCRNVMRFVGSSEKG